MRPLRSGDVIDFAAEACDVEAMLRVDFAHACEVRHDVSGFARALRNKYIHTRCGGAGAGARRLEDDFVDGLVGHGQVGNFADLQACAQQLDARSAEGIAFQQRNLQLALAETEDYVSLLRLFHEQACERRLADNDVDGQLAVDAIGHAQHQAARAQQAGGFRDALADKVGMVTSRPWMAMRIAVIALRNAAEARMKTRRAIWPSSSRRLRKFREGLAGSDGSSGGSEYEVASSVMGNAVQSRKLKVESEKQGI